MLALDCLLQLFVSFTVQLSYYLVSILGDQRIIMPRSDFPPPAADSVLWSAEVRKTYSFVVRPEQAAASNTDGHSLSNAEPNNHTTNVVCARITGYLILEPLYETARTYVLSEVNSCHERHASFFLHTSLNSYSHENKRGHADHFRRI